MESRKYWFIEKLAKLRIDDERISTLNEIKEEFSSLSHNDAKVIAEKLDLPAVFDCLNDTNQEQVDLACDVLTMCMGQLSLGESTKKYTISLERAIKHPSPHVKLMALNEIERTASSNKEELLSQIIKSSSLLENLIKCVGDDNLEVAKIASNVIINMCTCNSIVQQLMSPVIISQFQEVIAESEVVKLRIFELMVTVAVQSKNALHIFEYSGLLSHLLADLDSKDILLRMNILELLSQLVSVEHGYHYVKKENIITKLEKQFNDVDTNVEFSFCEPGLLKFFGHLGHWRPNEILSQNQLFVNRLFYLLTVERCTHYAVALDVLGHIADTNSGKIALESLDGKMCQTIKSIIENIPVLESQIKPRALNCLESCFHISNPDSRVRTLLRIWFDAIPNDRMKTVLRYAQDPTIEVRLAGLKLLQAVCEHDWGHEYIKYTPGTVEFLLNRNSEISKDGKEIKYDIVKLLSGSVVLESNLTSRLQEFVREGPFYVQAVTEVAFEGDD